MSHDESRPLAQCSARTNGANAGMNLVVLTRLMLVFLLTLTVASLLVASAACGDDEEADRDTATTAVGTGTGDGGGETSFDVTLTDNAFDKTDLNVSAGAVLTVSLTNEGAAIHNMRIAGQDGEFDTNDDAVSDPDMLSAGETATVEWMVPGEAGDYDFRCDFHPTEMTGTITIR